MSLSIELSWEVLRSVLRSSLGPSLSMKGKEGSGAGCVNFAHVDVDKVLGIHEESRCMSVSDGHQERRFSLERTASKIERCPAAVGLGLDSGLPQSLRWCKAREGGNHRSFANQ